MVFQSTLTPEALGMLLFSIPVALPVELDCTLDFLLSINECWLKPNNELSLHFVQALIENRPQYLPVRLDLQNRLTSQTKTVTYLQQQVWAAHVTF